MPPGAAPDAAAPRPGRPLSLVRDARRADGPLAALEPRAPRDAARGGSVGFHDPRRATGPGRLDIGATHYPEGGPYDSRDPARIRAQLALAREAGLDGFLVSWWGRESEDALGLAALFRGAGEAGPGAGALLRDGRALAPRRVRAWRPTWSSLLDRHGREPAWLRVGGVARRVPLRVAPAAAAGVGRGARPARCGRAGGSSWWPMRRAPSGWPRGRTGSSASTPSTCTRRSCSSRGAGTWATSYRALGGPRARGRAAVHPGRRARVRRPPGPNAGHRRGSRRMARPTTRAGEAALAVDPPWILVSSWNEWHEGSEIEPSARARAALSRRDARAGPSASGRARPDERPARAGALTRLRPRLGPRALPVEGIERPGIEPPVVEAADVREQGARQPPAVLLVGRERSPERRRQLLEHGGLVDPGDASRPGARPPRRPAPCRWPRRGPGARRRRAPACRPRGRDGSMARQGSSTRSAARPAASSPMRSPKGVVAAPSSVAMRKIWALVGTSSSIPGTRWSRSAEAHLLEHVAVVVDAGLVQAERRPARRPPGSGSRGAMPLRRRRFELGLVQIMTPRPATRSMSRSVSHTPCPSVRRGPEEAEPVEVLRRGAARAPARVLALVGGLVEVHVHPHLVPGRALAERRQRRVGAPVQVGGRELDARSARRGCWPCASQRLRNRSS